MRNCTGDEGGPFEVGHHVLISSQRQLLLSKAMVVSVVDAVIPSVSRGMNSDGNNPSVCQFSMNLTVARLVLSFERQAEGELTVHRHDGVEVETDMVVDRGHVAPGALQWMAMLQAAAAGSVEDQVYPRLSLIRDKRLATPAKKPNCHRRFAIVPHLEFCGVDRVLRHQPAGVDARRRLTDALLDSLEVSDLLAAEHDGSVSLAHLVLVDEPF